MFTPISPALYLTLTLILTDSIHQLPIQTLFPSSLFYTLYAPRTVYAKFDKVFNTILMYSCV